MMFGASGDVRGLKLMWARITHRLFGLNWVVLYDFNGLWNIRLLRHNRDGMAFAWRYWEIRAVGICPGGRLTNGHYVERWEPALRACSLGSSSVVEAAETFLRKQP